MNAPKGKMNMSLTRKQFDILEALVTSQTALSQRELEKQTSYSLGTINKTVKELTEQGLIADGAITNSGINALEPYRAKRAIFIAAGFGSRLVPITFNTGIALQLVQYDAIRSGTVFV